MTVNWNQLKNEEYIWTMTDQQKQLLAERVTAKAEGPRTVYLPPVWKPLLGAAALFVCAFVMILAWPKKPPEETIVTLPGASQEALPDDYVSSENKEPVTQNTEKEDPAKEPTEEKEPGVVTTPEKEESPSVSFADAYGVAKEKAHRRNFNKELTDSQREALKVYLTAENFAYLQGQVDGNITAFKEVGSKQYNLDIWLFAPESAVGKDLTAGDSLTLSGKEVKLTKLDPKVLDLSEVEGNLYFYPRLMVKEIQKSEEYLQNVTFGSALPEGQMRLRLQLSSPLSKENVRELVAHYLGHEKITWIELSYHVEEDTSSPTAIHRFWETQKEMPFEEARAIVVEKVTRRFNEKLSDKERMAYYVVETNRIKQKKGTHNNQSSENLNTTNNKRTSYRGALRIFTTKSGLGLEPGKAFNPKALNLGGGTFSYKKYEFYPQRIHIPSDFKESEEIMLYLPNGEGNYAESRDDITKQLVNAEYRFLSSVRLSEVEDYSIFDLDKKDGFFDLLIRHHLSYDCVLWVDCESDFYFDIAD